MFISKQLTALLLALVMGLSLGLTACGGSSSDNPSVITDPGGDGDGDGDGDPSPS